MNVAFSYLVAVHNEEHGLPTLVARLRERLVLHPGSEIVLCENGSSDASLAIAKRLAQEEREKSSTPIPIRVLTTTDAGLGYGLAMGMQDVIDHHHDEGAEEERWIVLTAADLPFAFTDLDELITWRERNTHDAVLIGSKAHPKTIRQRGWKRALATAAFRGLRVAVLGMKTGDPQGTFFIPLKVASQLLPRIRARNYFFTTELVYFAERSGIPVVEVPVVFDAEQRKSTVRIMKHGREMAAQTVRLRLRDLSSRASR